MALDNEDIRGDGHAPRHLRKSEVDEDDRTEPPMSGVIHLAEEVRDARAAGRKLANVDSDLVEDDIVGLVIKLREEVAGFRLDNKRAVKKMDQTLYEMRNLVDRVEELYNSAKDETHSAEQAALNGVNKAQEKAQEITLRNIDEATQRSKKAIDTMVLESKRRIERLAMVTLPDRMFHFLKWTALMLVLFILVHIAWQMFS